MGPSLEICFLIPTLLNLRLMTQKTGPIIQLILGTHLKMIPGLIRKKSLAEMKKIHWFVIYV